MKGLNNLINNYSFSNFLSFLNEVLGVIRLLSDPGHFREGNHNHNEAHGLINHVVVSVHGESSLSVNFKLNFGGGVGHQHVEEVGYKQDDGAELFSSHCESSASHVAISKHCGYMAFIRGKQTLFGHVYDSYFLVPPGVEVTVARVEATGPGVLIHEYVVGLKAEVDCAEDNTHK